MAGRDKDFGDERLNHIWEHTAEYLPIPEVGEAAELFKAAFVDLEIDSEARKAAREEFADLMESYSFDIADFDWDAWRDWYDSQ